MFHENQQIGQYTLIRKLGKGGFGEVWLAEKRSQFVTKRVAVKLPLDEQVNFEAIRQEATLWEQASGHANVLPIIDADVYDGQVVIVSEYADGGSLHDKLKTEGKLPIKQAVEMTIGILNGLEFLHNKRIIHRDIKPQNILLQGETPRLADFGISRAMQTTAISSTITGTDAYMSPESFDGKRSVQSDIWAVGVVLYQLLTGSLPFPQEHPTERMFAILTKDFEPLPVDVPQSLQRIIAKSLAKLPKSRYQTASEIREDLKKILVIIQHPTFEPTEVLQTPIVPVTSEDSQSTIQRKSFNSDVDNNKAVVTKISDVPKPVAQFLSPKVEPFANHGQTEKVYSLPMIMIGVFAAFLIGGSIIGLIIYAMTGETEKAQNQNTGNYSNSNKLNNDDSILDLVDANDLAKLKNEGLTIIHNPFPSRCEQSELKMPEGGSENINGDRSKTINGVDVRDEIIDDVSGVRSKYGKPNPLMVLLEIKINGNLTLNCREMGNVLRENTVLEKLREIFKNREENGVYGEGTNLIIKTVTIKVPTKISRDIFNKTLKIVKDSGASPINLSVEK